MVESNMACPNRLKALVSKNRLCFLAILFCCHFTVNASHLAYAEELSAEEVRLSTPAYQPNLDNFNPPLGTYYYGVSWQGIPAASATTTISREGDFYRIVATARTAKAIDLLFKLRYSSEGILSTKSFTPFRTIIEHRENSRYRSIQVNFLKNGEILTKRKSNNDYQEIRFNPENFTLDPFAAAMLARGLDWKTGQTRIFDTYNGKSRYLISLTCHEKTTIDFNGQKHEVWVVIPQADKVTDRKANSKLSKARIFVTSDERREILRIQSNVFIGSVKTELEKFVPLVISAENASSMLSLH
jgi:hypothetical protein